MNWVRHRVKHAVQAQNVFRHLVRRAEGIGMKVNTSKTVMMCVSDALGHEADAYLLDKDSERISCQRTMKILGMCFSNRPTMPEHVEWL